MTNISATSAIENGTADSNRCYASVVSNNFSQIAAAINASKMNSENYAISGVLSQHISNNAVVSQHISNSQVVSAKISQGGVIHDKLDFVASDAGVKVLRIGASDSSGMPSYSPCLARMAQTWSTANLSADNWNSIQINFSAAEDGDPGFVSTPVLCGQPVMQGSGTGHDAAVTHELFRAQNFGGMHIHVVGLNSESCAVWFSNNDSDSNPVTVTVHMAAKGAGIG